ncbi:MAG: hypothetical protein AAF291_14745 [Pseudomonadota bacterium]
MTLPLNRAIAAFAILSTAALSGPLAAESAAPMDQAMGAKPAAMVPAMAAVPSSATDALPSQNRSGLDQLNGVRAQANILRWDAEFAKIDEATPLAKAARGPSANPRSFALEDVTPDFGEPETLASEYDLAQGVTFQPRAPVRQAIGAEFEQTYAFAPSTNAASRLDGNVSTVGRVTNVRVRF